MVAYGIVKFFNREELYGFITVLDLGGLPTGEEVHFHYLNGAYPRYMGSELRLGSSISDDNQSRLEFPRVGQQVVFMKSENQWRRDYIKWSYRQLWDTMETYGTLHPITWRIVQKRWEGDEFAGLTGSPRYPGGKVVEEIVVKSGACSIAQFFGAMGSGKTPELYGFDVTEKDGERYTYELQLHREQGEHNLEHEFWLFVRLMMPTVPQPYDEEYDELEDGYEGFEEDGNF